MSFEAIVFVVVDAAGSPRVGTSCVASFDASSLVGGMIAFRSLSQITVFCYALSLLSGITVGPSMVTTVVWLLPCVFMLLCGGFLSPAGKIIGIDVL